MGKERGNDSNLMSKRSSFSDNANKYMDGKDKRSEGNSKKKAFIEMSGSGNQIGKSIKRIAPVRAKGNRSGSVSDNGSDNISGNVSANGDGCSDEEVSYFLNEVKDKFKGELFDAFLNKLLGRTLHLSKRDKGKIMEIIKKEIIKEAKKNRNEERKLSKDFIREKYYELVKKKEQQEENKFYQEIKEELKKTKELSPLELDISNYIKENQLINEYYVNKYKCSSEKSGRSSEDKSEGVGGGIYEGMNGDVDGSRNRCMDRSMNRSMDEGIRKNFNGENFINFDWLNKNVKLQEGGQEEHNLMNFHAHRSISPLSDASRSIVNLNYGGRNTLDWGVKMHEWGEAPLVDETHRTSEAYHKNESNHGGESHQRNDTEEKRSDISDFTFNKCKSYKEQNKKHEQKMRNQVKHHVVHGVNYNKGEGIKGKGMNVGKIANKNDEPPLRPYGNPNEKYVFLNRVNEKLDGKKKHRSNPEGNDRSSQLKGGHDKDSLEQRAVGMSEKREDRSSVDMEGSYCMEEEELSNVDVEEPCSIVAEQNNTITADGEINRGKKFYKFIVPLTPYELYMINKFYQKGIKEELKEFRNKDYVRCSKYMIPTVTSRSSFNMTYIKYKIHMMKSLLKVNLKYIKEKKYTKALKVCVRNGEYIRNFIRSYCIFKTNVLKKNHRYFEIYLNLDRTYITMDELKNILKSNVRNIIICKILILINEYKHYKYIENSSLILILYSILCRIIVNSKLLNVILKKFIVHLFLRGCLYYVEKMCNFFFLLFPYENKHFIISRIYNLSKNSFLRYSTCYKSNKYALINNYHYNFENCIKNFSPEWGYYIYTTSNFNIFSSNIKFNGFLKKNVDFSIISDEQCKSLFNENNSAVICNVVGNDATQYGNAHTRDQSTDQERRGNNKGEDTGLKASHNGDVHICSANNMDKSKMIVLHEGNRCDNVNLPVHDVHNEKEETDEKKGVKKISLYNYLLNYEKKKRYYYIVDDNMKRIQFSRKETNYNLETYIQFNNQNDTTNEQDSMLDHLMKNVNCDAYLNTSMYPYKNTQLLGNCPYCNNSFKYFTRTCNVCQRHVHICYYFFIYCTYKYHCELCDATYSDKV
ncbi:conserved Plasmodium protein, unknown function [Plasmodium malariae]|uniref:Uncharacterized protein n=1 Tax=Plasmodium malariae TaxID=5858 RepID=A0A1A8WWK7_PLAMA|nr:conserved Plasmodium protein, unknown function [Plasmodium malariae]